MRKIFTKSVLALFGLMMFANMANAQNMNRWIELTVKKGATIYFQLSALVDNTPIRVVSGSADSVFTVSSDYNWNDPYYSCYAGDNTMKVYGDLKYFLCKDANTDNITAIDASHNDGLESLSCYDNNSMSSLNVRGCKALVSLNCYYNSLSSLDLSGLTALKYLNCYVNSINYINLTGCSALEHLQVSDNNLSSLDIRDCSALKNIVLYGNKFSTQALDDIFCMLPTRLPSDEGFIYVLRHPTDDPNLVTVMATNKKNANDKFWSVTDSFYGYEIPATTGDYVCQELENYPLWVGGVQVTSLNASNITGSGITGGVVSYDPATQTLTLNNATITGYHAVGPTFDQSLYNIYSNDNININVIGTNSLKLEKDVYDDQLRGYGICAYYSGYKDVNLIGSGILNIETNVNSDYGVYENYGIVGESILIGGSITLNINSSDYGIYSTKAISISGGVSLEITTNATYSGRAFRVPKDKLTIDNISDRVIMQGDDAASATSTPSLTMQDDGTISWSKSYVKIYRLPIINMERYVELTVQQGQQITLDILADAENTGVKVVSGTYDTTLIVGTSWSGYIDYYAQGSKMKIYGNVKEFYCFDNGMNLTGLDASNNKGLEVLYCGSNNLSSLDVSGLTALKRLDCYTNNISSIKISGCDSLSVIFCDGNNLSACGLDSIFYQLPIRPESDKGEIYIKNLANTNPGAQTCRDTIATNRNWEVLDYNDNCPIPFENTTYECPDFSVIEEMYAGSINVYPNPASNFINVVSENANELITISDLSGKIVHSEQTSEKQTSINVSQLSAGMYIVRVGDKATKFVKE